MSDYEVHKPADYYARLAGIAERLGVAPLPEDHTSPAWEAVGVSVNAKGQDYDLFAIIDAILDRLDDQAAENKRLERLAIAAFNA